MAHKTLPKKTSKPKNIISEPLDAITFVEHSVPDNSGEVNQENMTRIVKEKESRTTKFIDKYV